VQYTNGFKARMIERMAGSEGISATALSKEVGVCQATLSRWLRDARIVRPMSGNDNDAKGSAKSSRQWSLEDKLRVVIEASRLSEEELGAFLRKEGLYESQLSQWRAAITEALSTDKPRRARSSAEAKEIKRLEKELLRKDRALAEVTALLALKKKVQEIWGDGDDDTPTRRGT